MRFNHRWIVILLVAGCLPLSACKKMSEEEEEGEGTTAKVIHQEEAHPDQPTIITLDEDAVKRIDVQTAAIEEVDISGAKQKVMPYAALLYDTAGNTWTFTSAEPLTFVRQKIKVDRIEGDKAILAEGPAAGTQVVTVGIAQLYGSEEEFEEE